MTYDVLLWTRGVSAEEITRARPDLIAAARFKLYAERLQPLLDDAEQVRDTAVTRDMAPAARLRLGEAKMQAGERIAQLRAALYPEDE